MDMKKSEICSLPKRIKKRMALKTKMRFVSSSMQRKKSRMIVSEKKAKGKTKFVLCLIKPSKLDLDLDLDLL